ncbi:MAG TPA: type II toxin-antitoxin system death-on-curing family toxin [Fimbriimonadaceae bacterium]|jgi:death-on-curing protein
MDEPRFLSVDDVLALHTRAIKFAGGESSVRDYGLLESAVAAAQATFESEYLYRSIAEMAARYWCSLCSNHPFVDGNKRTSLYAVDAFLSLNGLDLKLSYKEAEDITLRIATRELTFEEVAKIIAERTIELKDSEEVTE